MTIFGAATIERFTKRYADARRPAVRFLTIVRAANWSHLAERKRTFGTADLGKRTGKVIFDLGNKYRIVANVDFPSQAVFIEAMLTHEQYNQWRDL